MGATYRNRPCGMRCAKCGCDETQIIDSRGTAMSNIGSAEERKQRESVRRRRVCKGCGHRFSTYEVTEDRVLAPESMHAIRMLIKHFQKVEVFMRELAQQEER